MNQSELLSRKISNSYRSRNTTICHPPPTDSSCNGDTYNAQAYYIIEGPVLPPGSALPLIFEASGTITLTSSNRGTTYVLTGGELNVLSNGGTCDTTNIYTCNFITSNLNALDSGLYVYVKNGTLFDLHILKNGQPLSPSSVQSVLYKNKRCDRRGHNTPICILYWTGTDLVLY